MSDREVKAGRMASLFSSWTSATAFPRRLRVANDVKSSVNPSNVAILLSRK